MMTPRQRETLSFIRDYIAREGRSPTLEEVAAALGVNSPATVHKHVTALVEAGYLRRSRHTLRSLELAGTEEAREVLIPLLGRVAAGRPIEALFDGEAVSVPRRMLGRGRTFALEVVGDSMIGEHILDGDTLVVESRQAAEHGDIAVVRLEGGATVKKYCVERGGAIVLKPANPRYRPIRLKPGGGVRVEGIVRHVLRSYRREGDGG
jgi:repressor LexA